MTTIVQKKTPFEEAIDKLDLNGCLLLMALLSQRAVYLQNEQTMNKPGIVKPAKNILHA